MPDIPAAVPRPAVDPSRAPAASAPREAPLELDPETFRLLGHDLVDRIARYLGGLRDGPVTGGETPDEIRQLLGAAAALPEEGADPAQLLSSTADLLMGASLHNGHPRFLGYITSSAAPVGMLGDLLASAVNPNVGAWKLSPMASEIEGQAIRWISELVGFGGGGGLLLSGGNMANMAAFWAARVRATGEGIRAAGAAATETRLRVYASAETHTWLHKAADLSGVGTDAIRWIPTLSDFTMDLDALRDTLERDVAAGDTPLMVVATAGSVSTGAVDDIPGLAAICRERGIWLHVDGAYGAPAAVLPDAPEPLRHLALADSLALDPHKWLYAPLEAGCLLVRDPATLRDAFSYHPPYYHFGVEATNYVDLGPQNSRGFRALKVWLALRQVGRAGYRRMIGDDVRHARILHREAEAHPELETYTCQLSISTFRYVPAELRGSVGEPETEEYLERLNRTVQQRMETEGEAFLSNAVLGGRYVLRGCIVNFRTDQWDVEAIPKIVARVGREVHRELSAPGA